MKKKVFITGVGGYVGSAIAVILGKEYNIVGFGHGENFSVLRKMLPKNSKLVSGDIADKKKICEASRGAHAIIHAASPTKEQFCVEHPREAARAIVTGTRVVKEAAALNKIPLLIHFSTQAVYGNFKKRPLPLREDMKLMPDTTYGKLKARAEGELKSKIKNQRSEVVIIRPANIYGVGSGIVRGNVIHTFAEKAPRGEPLIVKGGKQLVDFVHVRDVAALVKKILKKPLAAKLVIVNAGSGKSVSVGDVASIVAEESERLFGCTPRVVIQKMPRNSLAADRYLSVHRAKKLFGWEPKISLEKGVSELLGQR